jgi:hypothetical protein
VAANSPRPQLRHENMLQEINTAVHCPVSLATASTGDRHLLPVRSFSRLPSGRPVPSARQLPRHIPLRLVRRLVDERMLQPTGDQHPTARGLQSGSHLLPFIFPRPPRGRHCFGSRSRLGCCFGVPGRSCAASGSQRCGLFFLWSFPRCFSFDFVSVFVSPSFSSFPFSFPLL